MSRVRFLLALSSHARTSYFTKWSLVWASQTCFTYNVSSIPARTARGEAVLHWIAPQKPPNLSGLLFLPWADLLMQVCFVIKCLLQHRKTYWAEQGLFCDLDYSLSASPYSFKERVFCIDQKSPCPEKLNCRRRDWQYLSLKNASRWAGAAWKMLLVLWVVKSQIW